MYMIDFFGGAPCESQAPQRQIEGTRNGSCKSHAVVSVAEPRRARPFLGHFVCTVVRPSAHRKSNRQREKSPGFFLGSLEKKKAPRKAPKSTDFLQL